MATKAEVERQLGRLMSRLDGNETNVRSAIPTRKVLRCHVADLDAAWYSVVEHGHVSQPSETPPNGRAKSIVPCGSSPSCNRSSVHRGAATRTGPRS